MVIIRSNILILLNKQITMRQNKRLTTSALIALAMLGGAGASYAGLASADTTSDTGAAPTTREAPDGKRPDVFGEVTAISGTTLTVTSKGPQDSTTTTYSVDVSGATIQKGSAGTKPTTATVSSIAIGDKVAIRGTVSGTSVTATEVMDGVGGPGGHGRGPGVVGTVSAVSGNTITLTNADGTTYTVEASSAKVSKVSTISVSDIAVGDKIGVEGTVSGTSVTATGIMDGMPEGGPAAK